MNGESRVYPDRHIGAVAKEDEGERFEGTMMRFVVEWGVQRDATAKVGAAIDLKVKEPGYGG